MDLEVFYNLRVSYLDQYVENNSELRGVEYDTKQLYLCVCRDVDLVLSRLNIMPSKSGYQFWKDSIFLYLMSDKPRISICNDIYPYVAQKHNTTPSCVDRAMRRCFENANYYLPKNDPSYIVQSMKAAIEYPHTSEIISKIVELISSKEFQSKKGVVWLLLVLAEIFMERLMWVNRSNKLNFENSYFNSGVGALTGCGNGKDEKRFIKLSTPAKIT